MKTRLNSDLLKQLQYQKMCMITFQVIYLPTLPFCTVNSTVSVSNEINDACFFETKVWRNKSAFIVQQIIPPNYDRN